MNNPVKVCQLSDAHTIYDDRIYWKYCLSLKKHGYDVTYIAPNKIEIDQISEEGIRLIGVVNTIYFKNRFLNKLYKIVFRKDLKNKIFSIAESLKSDVYHFHNINLIGIGRKLKRLKSCPIVIYDPREPYYHNIKGAILDTGFSFFFKRIYANYLDKKEKRYAKSFDLIIPNEDNVGNFFIPYVGKDKVKVIYNYTDLNPNFERIDFNKRKYDAIYCGNISKNRGALTILESAKYIKQIRNDFKVLLLGIIHDKSLKNEINEYILKNNLNKNVIIKDFVPYKEVHNYYLESKIGLILFKPLESYKIILPIKVFEYMVFGLPIVCSNFGQIQDYILKYKTGNVVDPLDVKQIAQAIIQILEDQEKFQVFSNNGINAAKEHFTWKIMEKKLIGIYSDVLKNNC